MKFVLSTFATPTRHYLELATTAEANGWSMMTLSDHVVNVETLTTPYPYTPDGKRRWPEFTEFPDQMVMIGALAAVTKTMKFTTNAFVLPMRDPFMVAKAIATISAISGNRIVPAFGVGWSKDEFDILRSDFSTRGKRADEMLEILRLLWTGGYVEYHGRYYDFPRLEMNPKPDGHIPIWIGGISDAALRRVARAGDGWLTDYQSGGEILASIAKIRAWRREYGRPEGPFDVMATPSDVFGVQAYRDFEAQGVTHLIMQPWQVYSPGTQDLQLQKDALKRFADDIIVHCG